MPLCSQGCLQPGDYGGAMAKPRAIATVLAASLLVGGCAVGEPIVPANISEMVNEQGRERTFDLVWQEIRRFEGALERGEPARFDDEALIILSRINRLAEGRASGLRSDKFRDVLTAAEQEAGTLNTSERRDRLSQTAMRLRTAFDAGEFAQAQQHALTALGFERALNAG